MLKKNVEGLEKMAADYLQYRYRMFCHGRRDADWAHYRGACDLIQAIGGEWRRNYRGDDSKEQQNDPKYYSHWVILPSDERCKNLNFNAWEE